MAVTIRPPAAFKTRFAPHATVDRAHCHRHKWWVALVWPRPKLLSTLRRSRDWWIPDLRPCHPRSAFRIPPVEISLHCTRFMSHVPNSFKLQTLVFIQSCIAPAETRKTFEENIIGCFAVDTPSKLTQDLYWRSRGQYSYSTTISQSLHVILLNRCEKRPCSVLLTSIWIWVLIRGFVGQEGLRTEVHSFIFSEITKRWLPSGDSKISKRSQTGAPSKGPAEKPVWEDAREK